MKHRIAVLSLLFACVGATASTPHLYPYKGEITNPDGTPSTDTVSLIVQIFDPSGGCLLYEQSHNGIDLSLSAGRFSILVGSTVTQSPAIRSANDPALTMTAIFDNQPAPLRAVGSANCSAGYTPTNGDTRKLRITVIDPQGVPDVLTPDHIITSAAFATNAATLQGKQPGDFVAVSGNITQAKLDSLAAGTDNTYLKADGSNLTGSSNFGGNAIGGVADPTSAQQAATKNYTDTKLGGQTLDTAGLADGQTLVWDAANSKWVATTPSSGSDPGGATIHAGSSGNIVLTSSSDRIHDANFSLGGSFQLPDATTLGEGGPLYTIFNSSNNQLPVLDDNGDMIASINGNQDAAFYLMDGANAAGIWKAKGNTSDYGHESIQTFAPTLAAGVTYNNYRGYQIDADKWIVLYTESDNTAILKAVAISVNTTTKAITQGAAVTVSSDFGGSTSYHTAFKYDTSRGAIVYRNGSGNIMVNTFSYNGSMTLTLATEIDTLSAYYSGSIVGHAVSATSFVVAFKTASASMKVHGLTVDGSHNPVNQTSQTIAVSSSSYQHDFQDISGNDLVFYYQNGSSQTDLRVISFNGSTITLNTAVSVTSIYNGRGELVRFDAGNFYFVYRENGGQNPIKGQLFTVSGSTITAGTTDTIHNQYTMNEADIVPEGAGFRIYAGESMNQRSSYLVTLSGSVSVAAAVTHWLYDCFSSGGRMVDLTHSYCLSSTGPNLKVDFYIGMTD